MGHNAATGISPLSEAAFGGGVAGVRQITTSPRRPYETGFKTPWEHIVYNDNRRTQILEKKAEKMARLRPVGVVVCRILEARGHEIDGPEAMARLFNERGFEEAIGLQASNSNTHRWFWYGKQSARLPRAFGPWFARCFKLERHEIRDWAEAYVLEDDYEEITKPTPPEDTDPPSDGAQHQPS